MASLLATVASNGPTTKKDSSTDAKPGEKEKSVSKCGGITTRTLYSRLVSSIMGDDSLPGSKKRKTVFCVGQRKTIEMTFGVKEGGVRGGTGGTKLTSRLPRKVRKTEPFGGGFCDVRASISLGGKEMKKKGPLQQHRHSRKRPSKVGWSLT